MSIFATLEPPTVVAGLDDIAVVGEAIEQCSRYLRITEDARPLPEGEVRVGFSVVWIDRGGGAATPTNSDVPPAEFYKLQRGRAEKLGYQPDFRIKALTDLPLVVSGSVP